MDVFFVRSDPRLYNEKPAITDKRTVTLRLVGGDEKGSLNSETVKYGCESRAIQTRERLRWQGPAASTKDRPVLSSERAPPQKQDHNCQTVINISGARHQDLLTDRQSQRDFDWQFISKSEQFQWSVQSEEGESRQSEELDSAKKT
jgi:hypothetical protein